MGWRQREVTRGRGGYANGGMLTCADGEGGFVVVDGGEALLAVEEEVVDVLFGVDPNGRKKKTRLGNLFEGILRT